MRIGIDLGGTKIEIIAIDEHGREIHRQRVPTPQQDYAATLNTVIRLIHETEEQTGEQGSVGIGTPGAMSLATGRMKNCNSTCLIGKDFQSDLEQLLGRQVRMMNDANCFALSEATDGAAAGAEVVFGVIIGTGVGAGIIVFGRPLIGANAIAGEWGHNPLPWPRDDERPGPDRGSDSK